MKTTTLKTVDLGKTPEQYRTAFKKAGMQVSSYADDLLGKMPPVSGSVDLVRLSSRDIGFEDGATYETICNKAKKLGYELCPAEVGPALRLAYTDQPNGEWLRVAMEAITDSDGSRNVFGVVRDGDGPWLFWSDGNPDFFWDAGRQFVFVLPRKSSAINPMSSSDTSSFELTNDEILKLIFEMEEELAKLHMNLGKMRDKFI